MATNEAREVAFRAWAEDPVNKLCLELTAVRLPPALSLVEDAFAAGWRAALIEGDQRIGCIEWTTETAREMRHNARERLQAMVAEGENDGG